MKKLNGWQRLWILLTLLYILTISTWLAINDSGYRLRLLIIGMVIVIPIFIYWVGWGIQWIRKGFIRDLADSSYAIGWKRLWLFCFISFLPLFTIYHLTTAAHNNATIADNYSQNLANAIKPSCKPEKIETAVSLNNSRGNPISNGQDSEYFKMIMDAHQNRLLASVTDEERDLSKIEYKKYYDKAIKESKKGEPFKLPMSIDEYIVQRKNNTTYKDIGVEEKSNSTKITNNTYELVLYMAKNGDRLWFKKSLGEGLMNEGRSQYNSAIDSIAMKHIISDLFWWVSVYILSFLIIYAIGWITGWTLMGFQKQNPNL